MKGRLRQSGQRWSQRVTERSNALDFQRAPAVAAGRTRSGASRSQRRLVAAAFHEAGHAVAAYHLGLRLHRISIGKDEPKALGWLEVWPPRVSADELADLRAGHAIERSIIVLLAGSQAEWRGIGRTRYQGSSLDFYDAMRHAGRLCRTTEEMSAYLRWMQLRVRGLVASTTWRQPIEALATHLLHRRQLGAREARTIIRGAIPGTQRSGSIRRRAAAGSNRRAASARHSVSGGARLELR